MAQQDNDWEELAKIHLHSRDLEVNKNSSMLDALTISNCIKVFPLLYVVEKYNFRKLSTTDTVDFAILSLQLPT